MCAGSLVFSDSFVHGRPGAIVLKQLSEHAYSSSMRVEAALCDSLSFMEQGLVFGEPLQLTGEPAMNWFLYTDAAYEPTTHTGGIGAVLTDNSGKVVSWFGIQLDCEVCARFLALKKDTRKYELEMAAVVFAFLVWGRQVSRGL